MRAHLAEQKHKLREMYKNMSKMKFRQIKAKIMQMQEKKKLVDFFKSMNKREFYDRYVKRYQSLIEKRGILETY